jgi:PAS domain S-box-containing protein
LSPTDRRWAEYTGLSQLGKMEKVGTIAVHPEDRDRVVRRWDASFAGGEPFEEEMRIRRHDGEYRWFLNRLVPLRDKRGKVVKWYGAATDIQDRKRAEQLQAELAHTNRVSTMGEMVASISHELAQPLMITGAHAKASLRWLQRNPPELTEVRKGTERIVEASALASEIINRLRSLYKKAPPKQELVAINEVVGEMAGMMGGKAREHGVSIRTDLKDDLPMTLADRVQLQQVLMNLMLNGIEAIKDTGGVITVKSQLGEDGQIEISVNDTGAGLPWARPTRYLIRSLLRNHKVAAWAWQSASRSSNCMADGFGPTATAGAARRSTSPCQWLPRKQTLPWMQRDSALSRVGFAGPVGVI